MNILHVNKKLNQKQYAFYLILFFVIYSLLAGLFGGFFLDVYIDKGDLDDNTFWPVIGYTLFVVFWVVLFLIFIFLLIVKTAYRLNDAGLSGYFFSVIIFILASLFYLLASIYGCYLDGVSILLYVILLFFRSQNSTI